MADLFRQPEFSEELYCWGMKAAMTLSITHACSAILEKGCLLGAVFDTLTPCWLAFFLGQNPLVRHTRCLAF